MELNLLANVEFELSNYGNSWNIPLKDSTTKTVSARRAYISLPFTEEIRNGLKSFGIPIKNSSETCLGNIYIVFGLEMTKVGTHIQGYLAIQDLHSIVRKLFGPQLPTKESELVVSVGPIEGPHDWILTPLNSNQTFDVLQCNRIASNTSDFKIVPNFGLWTVDQWQTNAGWKSVISIKMLLSSTLDYTQIALEQLSLLNRLFDDEDFCDVTFIVQNDKEVKFHRCVLAAESPVFDRMFKTDMKEAESCTVSVPDMSEKCALALKKYLYSRDMNTVTENAKDCTELFQTAHKYDIGHLERRLEAILLTLGNDWFTVDTALSLFLFVNGLDKPNLKKKTITILRKRYAELEGLEVYQSLYKKDIEAAKELCKCFATNSDCT